MLGLYAVANIKSPSILNREIVNSIKNSLNNKFIEKFFARKNKDLNIEEKKKNYQFVKNTIIPGPIGYDILFITCVSLPVYHYLCITMFYFEIIFISD